PARSRPPPGWLPTIGAELPTTGMEQLSTDERSAPPPHAPGVHHRRWQLPLHGHPRWDRAMAQPRSVRPSRGTHRLARIVGEVAAQTCALVVTRQCPCGSEGTWLCPGCAAQLAAAPLRVESCCEALQHLSAARVLPQGPLLPAGVDHTPLLPVLALGEYAGDLQRLILAWKNGGMLHLGRRIAPGLAAAVTDLAAGAGRTTPRGWCASWGGWVRAGPCCCHRRPPQPRRGRVPASGADGRSSSWARPAAGPESTGAHRWSSSTTSSPPGRPCGGCTRH